MPTRDEFEHACRAGTETVWYTGDTEADLARIGWYRNNSGGEIHRVGQKGENPWGLCDMIGNVWTWVETDAPRGPNGDASLVKGGDYKTGAFGNGCRTANLQIQAYYRGVRVFSTIPDGSVAVGCPVERTRQRLTVSGRQMPHALVVLSHGAHTGAAMDILGRALRQTGISSSALHLHIIMQQ